MKFGLSESNYRFIQQNVVKPLQQLDAKVWCFGSRARGDHAPFSDLDLMVEPKANVNNGELISTIGHIREQLEDSDFPYIVELVQLGEFAHSYQTNYERDKTLF